MDRAVCVRFLLSALELLVGQLASVVASPLMSGTTTCLPQLLAQLLQIIIFILQSGERNMQTDCQTGEAGWGGVTESCCRD